MSGGRTTEAEISEAVLRILAAKHDGEASLDYIRKHIPSQVALTAGDTKRSDTRENEEMWEQVLRNVVSHKATEGNYIAEGYLTSPSRGRLRITDAGRRRVAA